MKHARADYNRIQDPALRDPSLLSPGSTPIGKDEPVFLIRAQDKCMIGALSRYVQDLARYGGLGHPGDRLVDLGDGDMILAVYRHIAIVAEWQDAHGCKVPDVPDACPNCGTGQVFTPQEPAS